MKGKIAFFLALGILSTCFYGCKKSGDKQQQREYREPNEPTVIKLGHSLPEDHPVHEAMLFMGERLKEYSNDRITIEIFPNEQLGSEREMIEQVQNDLLDMCKTSTSPLESFIPDMAVFSVPYIFRDREHYWKVLKGPIGEELKQSCIQKKLKSLCYYDSGSRSFYTKKKPILNPDDLKGMKIRVMESKTSMDMVKSLGAAPTPIAWGELYTALQQGVVDGAENNPPSLYTSRHYEVCKHYSLDEHTMIPDIVVMSKAAWESFHPHEQAWIQKAATESMEKQIDLWTKFTKKSMDEVQKAGVKVYKPDKAPFREKVKEMHRSYEGKKTGDYIKRIMAVE